MGGKGRGWAPPFSASLCSFACNRWLPSQSKVGPIRLLQLVGERSPGQYPHRGLGGI
jgi:hypothetical protein